MKEGILVKKAFISLSMLALVLLVSCTETTNYQSSDQSEKPPVAVRPETSQEDASSLLIMDKTVSVPLLRLTEKEKVMEVNATADFGVSYRDISELCEAAAVKNIVYGTVQEVGFYEGYPSGQTLYNFLVEKSFAGELQAGDKISVLASGGYLSLGRYIETYGGERFEDMTEQEIENTVLKQTCMGAPFAKTGEKYLLFLSKEKTQEDAQPLWVLLWK